MLVDYHVHGMGHGETCHVLGDLLPYLEQARREGIAQLGLAEHDWYLRQVNWAVLREAASQVPEVALRVGLEVEFRPGRRTRVAARLARYPFDYLIGSVHQIGAWMFDHPDYQAEYARWPVERLYRRYFGLVARLARWRLFDVVGHLDLIKIFGHRLPGPVLPAAKQALREIAQAGLAVELNTAGLYKPVGETYPARELLEAAFALNIPVTLGSDAHRAEEVGRSLELGARMLREVGYRSVTGFQARRALQVPL